jgi:hypothetical protein
MKATVRLALAFIIPCSLWLFIPRVYGEQSGSQGLSQHSASQKTTMTATARLNITWTPKDPSRSWAYPYEGRIGGVSIVGGSKSEQKLCLLMKIASADGDVSNDFEIFFSSRTWDSAIPEGILNIALGAGTPDAWLPGVYNVTVTIHATINDGTGRR